jgi:hypothetical protein
MIDILRLDQQFKSNSTFDHIVFLFKNSNLRLRFVQINHDSFIEVKIMYNKYTIISV